MAEPEEKVVGTLDEDFAVESHGGRRLRARAAPAWRIQRVCGGGGAGGERAAARRPPCPFWRGEAPVAHRRAVAEVGRLRDELLAPTRTPARWLEQELGLARATRRSCSCATCGPGEQALGAVPTAAHGRRRALLRRGRRHAAHHPRAVRRPHQPRLGPGAAQALLPHLRLRAAGGGDRRRHPALARRAAQLPAGGHLRLPAPGRRWRRC